jgi:integrative and conjugative element protein (TIGR02256 family)
MSSSRSSRHQADHADIAVSKAEATTDRLREVAPKATISGEFLDATELTDDDLRGVDLVIDATANLAVGERLEVLRRVKADRPAMVAVMVGHDCQRAVATIALPSSTGGGVDVQRRLAIAAFDDVELSDLRDDFYSSRTWSDLLQPEPGCSDPTFVGSAADLAGFAARLLNAALAFISQAERGAAAVANSTGATSAAVVIRQLDGFGVERPPQLLQWENNVSLLDDMSGYEVRVAPEAWASMRREAIRATQIERGAREAGGVLLGQFDPASRVIFISTALATTNEDDAAPGYLRLQFDEMREDLMALSRRTHGVLSFVGAWHTHPGSTAFPSGRDHDTMTNIVNSESSKVYAALLMILGGEGDVWTNWLAGTGRPAVYTTTYFAGDE